MDKKPELEDLIKHYGVKGMKWKNVQDKTEQEIEDAKNAALEIDSILRKGDFTGKGPWEEDSKIVDKLFDTREGFIKNKKLLKKLIKKYGNKTITSVLGKGKPGKFKAVPPDFEGKIGDVTVSRPFKNGVPKKKSNSKIRSSTVVTSITSPSRKEIEAVAKFEADKYKREHYTKTQKLVDRIKNRMKK